MQPYIVNGQFVKKDAYKKVIWTLMGMLLGVSVVTYLMSSNMFLTVFGFFTTLIGALSLLIFMRDRYTLDVEALRTPEKKFDVLIKGADMHIVNPQTIYFGITQEKDGAKTVNLGIPNGTALLVLSEKVEQNDAFKEVCEFLVPREFLAQDVFESKSQNPGEVTKLARFFGFL
jgi:hypothetical protein